MKKVALLGYGTVGKGVVSIIKKKREFDLVYIFARKNRFDPQYPGLFTDDIDAVIDNPEIDIVVETLGGFDFAYSCIKSSLEHRKSVVTANKEVVATKLDELTLLAKENGVSFMYEASVGGGIPIIKPLLEIVKTSEVSSIYGILNGTTNFILTKMNEGMDFEDALRKAQELGFAEKDPSADLEGLDMVRKIAVLADLAWNTFVPIDRISHISISKIGRKEIEYAKSSGLVIKFVCSAKKEGGKITLGVAPYYLGKDHPFAGVQNESNAIMLKTFPNGDLTFIGKGAGSLPTASAIVGDLYCIDKNMAFDGYSARNVYDFLPKAIGEEIERLGE
ncbi:MAG: homoserine dehydrogenase [Bacilli bacterium]|nr:homoserine dehydrogenase [Bacilli bacterium]